MFYSTFITKNIININVFLHKHTQTLPLGSVSRHFTITSKKILNLSIETSLSKYRHLYTLFGDLSHLIRNGRANNFIGYSLTKLVLSTN